jgi:anti-sigma factor RsiW
LAALVYRRREHVIYVFLWPDAVGAGTEPRRENRRGFDLVHWSRAGMNYWAVSDLGPAELNDLVQLLWE